MVHKPLMEPNAIHPQSYLEKIKVNEIFQSSIFKYQFSSLALPEYCKYDFQLHHKIKQAEKLKRSKRS